jgi:hypothetical protein
MQKILSMITDTPSLRSLADSWDAEDGDLIRLDKEIGYSLGYKGFYCHQTPMHAIGSGWKLLAPPTTIKNYVEGVDYYQWYFVKD